MKAVFTSKTDLAQAYFPYIGERSARHKLMQLINEDTTLITQLSESGYSKDSHEFSPNQLSLIISRLGNPFK